MSSLPDRLYQASELNEDGVYELSSGRSAAAIRCLNEAAQQLVQCLKELHSNNGTSTHQTSAAAASGSPYHTTYRVQIPHLQDDLFYIYSCVVTYAPPLQVHVPATQAQEVVLFELAVVLFNLALAHHQQGKAAPANGEASLRQALNYYRDCHQALQSVSLVEDSNHHNHEDLLLMTLAVMNNQAQILYELEGTTSSTSTSNSTTTSDSAGVFQKLLTDSMDAILHDDHLSVVEQSQIHEFVQNAMVFRLQRPCAAPSA